MSLIAHAAPLRMKGSFGEVVLSCGARRLEVNIQMRLDEDVFAMYSRTAVYSRQARPRLFFGTLCPCMCNLNRSRVTTTYIGDSLHIPQRLEVFCRSIMPTTVAEFLFFRDLVRSAAVAKRWLYPTEVIAVCATCCDQHSLFFCRLSVCDVFRISIAHKRRHRR